MDDYAETNKDDQNKIIQNKLYKNKLVHPLNCNTLHLVRIARKVDGPVHWIDLYPKDSGVYFVHIYPLGKIYPVKRVD